MTTRVTTEFLTSEFAINPPPPSPPHATTTAAWFPPPPPPPRQCVVWVCTVSSKNWNLTKRRFQVSPHRLVVIVAAGRRLRRRSPATCQWSATLTGSVTQCLLVVVMAYIHGRHPDQFSHGNMAGVTPIWVESNSDLVTEFCRRPGEVAGPR